VRFPIALDFFAANSVIYSEMPNQLSRAEITPKGKLKSDFLPAAYFDTGVLYDYWLVESCLGYCDRRTSAEKGTTPRYHQTILDLVEAGRELDDAKKLVEFIHGNGDNLKLRLIYTPLCLMELSKIYSEATFLDYVAEVKSLKLLQRIHYKNIGRYLSRLTAIGRKEHKDGQAHGSDLLLGSTHFDVEFLGEGLAHFCCADIVNYNLQYEDFLFANELSYLQVESSDIMHLLYARHLGCSYFVTLDDELARHGRKYEKQLGLKIVKGYERILNLFKELTGR
jgi:hypothetical protein